MNSVKLFFLDNRNIERDGFIWNMVGSMIMAFQSVIILIVLTRTLGLVDAGVFTIAFANANLFLNIGKYGMRFFQVSDVEEQFSFKEYLLSRVVTCILMMVISVVYTLYAMKTNNYSANKTWVILWMCLFKLVDAIEDVYHGRFQQINRLDVASRTMSVRAVLTISVFGAGLVIFKSLLLALIVTTIVTGILLFFFIKWTIGILPEENRAYDFNKMIVLLKSCFSLFAGAFLAFYIANAPKYAIDSMLSDELQACYGFIAMPVFVIGLLNSFIFNPMIYHMTKLWMKGEVKQFVSKTIVQIGIVCGITMICMAGAYLIGVPVLSVLYNTDLSPYKTELLIVLIGGGFLGLSGLLNTVITIIRFQNSLMWGYLVVAVLAGIFSNKVVGMYGVLGASVLYTVLMGGLCIVFSILFIVGILKKKNVSL